MSACGFIGTGRKTWNDEIIEGNHGTEAPKLGNFGLLVTGYFTMSSQENLQLYGCEPSKVMLPNSYLRKV